MKRKFTKLKKIIQDGNQDRSRNGNYGALMFMGEDIFHFRKLTAIEDAYWKFPAIIFKVKQRGTANRPGEESKNIAIKHTALSS